MVYFFESGFWIAVELHWRRTLVLYNFTEL